MSSHSALLTLTPWLRGGLRSSDVSGDKMNPLVGVFYVINYCNLICRLNVLQSSFRVFRGSCGFEAKKRKKKVTDNIKKSLFNNFTRC